MKKPVQIILMLILVLFSNILLYQSQNTVMPWMGMEEFISHVLPVGSWNVLGPFSARATAMGETFFASLNPSAAYVFGEVSRFQVSGPVFRILNEGFSDEDLPLSSQFIPPPFHGILTLEDHDLDLKGLFFSLCFNFKLSEKWLVGLALRPPFKIN